jgi:hypothetical protein
MPGVFLSDWYWLQLSEIKRVLLTILCVEDLDKVDIVQKKAIFSHLAYTKLAYFNYETYKVSISFLNIFPISGTFFIFLVWF